MLEGEVSEMQVISVSLACCEMKGNEQSDNSYTNSGHGLDIGKPLPSNPTGPYPTYYYVHFLSMLGTPREKSLRAKHTST